MPEAQPSRSHPRFRRRLTAAFVLVAATGAGVLGIITYTLSAAYRMQTFEGRSRDEAELALALAPEDLTETSFERLQAAYESRTGASTIARTSAGEYTSAADLHGEDIPANLQDPPSDAIAEGHTEINGVERFVLASRRSGTDYWFFFSTDPVHESLRDLRVVLGVAWLITAGAGAVVGSWFARRVLAPVRAASSAARSLASGLLETRLDGGGDDEFGAWTASFNDMAAALQQTIEQLTRAAERERQLTAEVAHELRTPLTGMAASSSLLREEVDRLTERGSRAAQILLDDVDRLRDLVLELLELARMDAGAEPTDLEPLDVERSVEAVVRAADGADDVVIAIPPGLRVRADRARLSRVLGNLLENAVRHGSPPVEISASQEGARISVRIRDHGPGIGADPDRLFDRFAKSDRSRAAGGSGLGLAIAAGHAAAMSAELRAANSPDGPGAVFTLRLPSAGGDRVNA
ncbi:MAG TPA: HAMP domain-containing sensor histidine kinase [Acidimicrobiales bacterium]|nr:HAMP domain-containing sensor histidine kinase [Acidimicrobiales bacterium]